MLTLYKQRPQVKYKVKNIIVASKVYEVGLNIYFTQSSLGKYTVHTLKSNFVCQIFYVCNEKKVKKHCLRSKILISNGSSRDSLR